MGKFNTNVSGNAELSQLEELGVAQVDLPAGESQGGSILDGIIADAGAAETAGIVEEGINAGLEQEQAIEEQREAEAVPDIITRRDDESRVDVYDYSGNRKAAADKASQGPSADGGLAERSKNMANSITEKSVGLGGLTTAASNPIKETYDAIGVLDETGKLDKGFLQMTSVITENLIAELAHGEGLEGVTNESIPGVEETVRTPSEKELVGQVPITKAQSNKQLGHQINREWQRYNNAAQGKQTDQYTDITDEQASLLGDVSKELYYETNKMDQGKQFLVRGATNDGQVAFTLTKHGADRLKMGSIKRKKMFPKQHVRPSKTPLPAGRLVGEGKTYTKRVSSKVRKPLSGAHVLEQAMTNLNKVPNVVDKQRLKVLLATALPVLKGEVDPNHVFATINHVGQDKVNDFAAKAAADPNFDAAENYAALINDLAQSIYGVSKERKGANYLTYYIQAFNGRIAPQQTHFDPTSSKTVRFVTRNAVPSKASPGSRVEKNLRQMYAMMLVKGADAELPAVRDQHLTAATPKLRQWGNKLNQTLNGITDEQVEAAAEAIAQGIPVTDPKFPQIASVALDPNQDAELIKAIQSKGEDGQAFIDGLIDFAAYADAKDKGIPHHSYFNAYMDGKTNGLAANGIQMGSQNVAYKTGVLRSNKRWLLDNNEDLRDDFKNNLLAAADNGFEGKLDNFKGNLHSIATKLYSNRNLNKSITMTFGYGMELQSFKKVIQNELGVMQQADPELDQQIKEIEQNTETGSKDLLDALHSKYGEALASTLDANGLKSRAIMRSAATLHALTNELFSIESATGFELNLGGTETTGWESGERYKVWTGSKYEERTAGQFGEESTAAAAKRRTDEDGNLTLEPGGIAYGGSVPGPVQSLDAATVGLTASGKSWNRLRNASGNNPYIHTIYDAFKVDAMGYDAVLEEVNNNWLDASMNWSYLEETRNAVDSLRERWQEKTKDIPNSESLSGPQWSMAGFLLAPVLSAKGKVYPGNLMNKLKALMHNGQEDGVAFKAAYNITNGMAKVGYNFAKPPTPPTMKHLREFMKLFNQEIQLAPRLNDMIKVTNEAKRELRAKIKRDGNKVYQYYSH